VDARPLIERTQNVSGRTAASDPIVAVNAFRMDVRFGGAAIVERTAPMVKVFGCWPAAIYRLGVGRRTETAHARTRGIGRCLYGDL